MKSATMYSVAQKKGLAGPEVLRISFVFFGGGSKEMKRKQGDKFRGNLQI